MMVSDGELLIKGRLMRMEALDEDRAGYVTIDLSAGITRMARPGEGICIDWYSAPDGTAVSSVMSLRT